MVNKKNLRKLSTSKAREIGKKGGIKSGEKRREQKKFREIFEMLLNKESTNDKGETATIKEVIAINTVAKAVKGDLRAVELIKDVLGENNKKNDKD
ncbi:MAG TPA: hypothetical protein VLL98_00210 [Rickettsiales bacterium]|nr:hypothetical protein [Rickettsiales bacterium]